MKLSHKDKQGIQIIIVVLALSLLLAAITAFSAYMRPRLNLANLCPDGLSVPHTVVLIDITDPLTSTQREYVLERIKDLQKHLDLYEKLSIYMLSDDRRTWNAEAVFSKCNPGSTVNPLTNTESQVRRRFVEFFEKPLDHKLAELMNIKESVHSPILEMLQSVSLKPDFAPTGPRRLLIVSDMMQNVPEYSHYTASLDYPRFANTDYGRAQEAQLANVQVQIIYLARERLRRYQTTEHINFWQQYFHASGAKLTQIPARLR